MESAENICLLVITDGRMSCIERTIASAEENLPEFGGRFIYNDSPDPVYAKWLKTRFPNYVLISNSSGKRSGFGGAINNAWACIPSNFDFVFHLEDDFTFNDKIPVNNMAVVLEENPNVVQLVLKRQPWNEPEAIAGGIVEMWPDLYTESEDGQYTTHRLFFSTNPSLYRRDLIVNGWPVVDHSENVFTSLKLEVPDNVFAFWGGKFDPPLVHHIGDERVGNGY